MDAVLLDDGTLRGEDRSDLAADFKLYLNAKQDLYRQTVKGLQSGSSLQEATGSIDVQLAMRLEVHKPTSIYARLAAQDADRWREEYGATSTDLFEQALRREPFIIKRSPNESAAASSLPARLSTQPRTRSGA
jgi:hypothetical protein